VTVHHGMYSGERKTNKMQLILCLLSNIYLNMFRASLCRSSGGQDRVLPHMVSCAVTGGEKNRKMWAIEYLCGVVRSKCIWDFLCICVWSCVYVYGHGIHIYTRPYIYTQEIPTIFTSHYSTQRFYGSHLTVFSPSCYSAGHHTQ